MIPKKPALDSIRGRNQFSENIMLKGSTLADLHYDTLALIGLMLIAMLVAVTRFRRTLD